MLAAAAVAPLVLTACAEHQEPAADGDTAAVPLSITLATGSDTLAAAAGTTRASFDLQSTRLPASTPLYAYFPDGGVTIGGTAPAGTQITTTGNGVGTTPATQPYLAAGRSAATVLVYYPYAAASGTLPETRVTNTGVNGTGTTFSVQRDQTADAAYRLSDLMMGTGLAVRNSSASNATAGASVNMRHLMAKIVVNVTAGQGIGSIKAVKMTAGKPTVNITNTASLTLGTTLSGTDFSAASPLTVYSNTAGERRATAACLVPPQTIAASADLLLVETDLGTIVYRLSTTAKELASGQTYTLNLTPANTDLGQTVVLPEWGAGVTVSRTDSQDKNLRFHVNGVPFNMAYVEGGSYNTLGGISCTGTLSDYWIGETEVTNELYKAVTGVQPGSKNTAANYPVSNVSYNTIMTAGTGFIAQLNTLCASQLPEGYSFALPSDAQWEFASRGGTRSQGFRYPGTDGTPFEATVGDNGAGTYYLSNEVAWNSGTKNGQNSNGSSGLTSHPVAMLKPNELGLYDMAGNEREIVADFATVSEGQDLGLDYRGPSGQACHRNGCYDNSVAWNLHQQRGIFTYDQAYQQVGFRLALVRTYPFPVLAGANMKSETESYLPTDSYTLQSQWLPTTTNTITYYGDGSYAKWYTDIYDNGGQKRPGYYFLPLLTDIQWLVPVQWQQSPTQDTNNMAQGNQKLTGSGTFSCKIPKLGRTAATGTYGAAGSTVAVTRESVTDEYTVLSNTGTTDGLVYIHRFKGTVYESLWRYRVAGADDVSIAFMPLPKNSVDVSVATFDESKAAVMRLTCAGYRLYTSEGNGPATDRAGTFGAICVPSSVTSASSWSYAQLSFSTTGKGFHIGGRADMGDAHSARLMGGF